MKGRRRLTNVITIPIPKPHFNTAKAISTNTYNGFYTTNGPSFNSVTNEIVWNLGTLPIAAGHPEYIYDLTFELNVTDDCSIILNTDQPVISFRNRNNIRYRRYIDYPYLLEISFKVMTVPLVIYPSRSIKVAIDGTSCLSVLAGGDLSLLW
jgi:hypothetical protein